MDTDAELPTIGHAMAYYGSEHLKAEFVQKLTWHRDRGAIAQNVGRIAPQRMWKGSAVACSIRSLNAIRDQQFDTHDHDAYEALIGVPAALASLEDEIFQGLTAAKARDWPLRFAEAIQVGADLSAVPATFSAWLMTDVERFTEDPAGGEKFSEEVQRALEQVRSALHKVRELDRQRLAGQQISKSALDDARLSARLANRVAAEAAEGAAATNSAGVAEATAAAHAARAANVTGQPAWSVLHKSPALAEAAWAAQEAGTPREDYFERVADKLIELLESAKGPLAKPSG